MKKLFQIVVSKLVRKVVSNPVVASGDDSQKALWRFVIQTLISILTAILTALGTTSCMGLH
ncbi:MAG: smalltalk protein [Bacteroidaceae bacterium]|nr:smalltalk protein [Bacteroidaceae bacterium]